MGGYRGGRRRCPRWANERCWPQAVAPMGVVPTAPPLQVSTTPVGATYECRPLAGWPLVVALAGGPSHRAALAGAWPWPIAPAKGLVMVGCSLSSLPSLRKCYKNA
ncbi:hypothetical protein BHM03_00037326 [Ensete ventricosum]|nr:hypothetical protein BHM03_00037326 [Ensete ventricosum]